MDKISIIVPIYNVQDYLRKCIDSLIDQTYKNIEIILVNDGTKDDSQAIVDEYVIKYPEIIKSYIKENGGLSDARNFGIKKASGEYITFVDSDDYVDKSLIEKLYNKIKEDKSDIVASGCFFVYEDKTKILSLSVSDNDDIKKAMIDLFPSAWGKLYRKEIFEKNLFKKGIWFEDVEFLMRVYPTIKKISIVNEPLYYYIQRENSITYTYNEKLNDLVENWNGIINYYKENNFFEEYQQELEYSYIRYTFATYIKRLAKTKDYNKFIVGRDFAINNAKKIFPNYKNNKYIKRLKPKDMYLRYFGKSLSKVVFLLEKNKKN